MMNNAHSFFCEMIKMKEKHIIKGKLCGLWFGQERRDRGEGEKGYNQFPPKYIQNIYEN